MAFSRPQATHRAETVLIRAATSTRFSGNILRGREQDIEILCRQVCSASPLTNTCCQQALAFLESNHPFLDRPGRDQSVDEDRLVLADAIGAIGSLVHDGRIPPWIIMGNGIYRR